MPKMAKIPKTIGSGEDPEKWGADNADWLKSAITKHENWIDKEQIEKLQGLYDGEMEVIEDRDSDRGDGINNKIMATYAPIVIDTIVDYMLGKAITWTVEDPDAKPGAKETPILEDFRKKFIAVAGSDEARLQLVEQLRQGCIAGYGSLIAWIDEIGEISYGEYPVQEVIPIYNSRGQLKLVLRKYKEEYSENGAVKNVTKVEVYDEKYVTYFVSDDTGGSFTLDPDEMETGNPYAHRVQGIPVTIYRNGTPAGYKARQDMAGVSDLKTITTALEDYAHKISDKSNLSEYLMDQYLLLIGVDTDENEVVKMRKARALVLKGDKNVSDAKFLSQTQDDATIENHLKRLKDLIFETSFTPAIGDATGKTAYEIKMKFKDLDTKAAKKEVYFAPTLKRFIEITVDLMNAIEAANGGDVEDLDEDFEADESKDTTYKAEWVGVTINRNIPQNHKEIADIVTVLAGVVPDSYLYELLWFIEDPKQALEEMKKQKAAAAKEALNASIGFNQDFNSTDLTDEQKAEQARKEAEAAAAAKED